MAGVRDIDIDGDARARIAKYEAWVAHLETVRARYAARRALYTRFFVGLVAASLLGFLRSSNTGLWASISAVVVSISGHFMVKTRLWEFDDEIAQMRAEIARLEGGGA